MALTEDQVHVWLAMLEELGPTLDVLFDYLSADERERAARFHFPEHRNQYVFGRGVLRNILSRYLGTTPSALRFSYNRHGKPALSSGALHFNLAHVEGLFMYAVAHKPVGIDVECMGRRVEHEEITARFFSSDEIALLSSLPAAMRGEAFLRCWTRKEAYVKLRGEGLSLNLGSFSVVSTFVERSLLLNPDSGPDTGLHCYFRELPVPSNYVATLAEQAGPGHVQYWCWHL